MYCNGSAEAFLRQLAEWEYMILFLVKNKKLVASLEGFLKEKNLKEHKVVDLNHTDGIDELYQANVKITGIVADHLHPKLPKDCWFDILDSLSRRVPLFVLSNKEKSKNLDDESSLKLAHWLVKANLNDVIQILNTYHLIGDDHDEPDIKSVAVLNVMQLIQYLHKNGSVSILSIHAKDFRSIGIEYGGEAYVRLQEFFKYLLQDIWGVKGSFRKKDLLCRNSSTGNVYYIILEQSRTEKGIPPPGALEKLADRIANKLQSRFWDEIFKPAKQRLLPAYLNIVPKFSIGYATSIYNPCVESDETIENLLEASKAVADVQWERIKCRQKEFIQVVVQTANILRPHFQAIFDLKTLDPDKALEANAGNTIVPIKDSIYGFESLIRVDQSAIQDLFSTDGPLYFESRFLRPDILFSLAKKAKLALELDQTCLKLAANFFDGLPGKLLANILPRNFYFVEELKDVYTKKINLIFEVSESEAINNFDLLVKAREKLPDKNFGIAIDDFGRGYAGLDRLLKIKPDIIKLDRCLIQDIHLEKSKRAFVKGLIKACQLTNSTVLAEGVEKIDELVELKKLGVDLIQGFLLHKPQDVEIIAKDISLVKKRKIGAA